MTFRPNDATGRSPRSARPRPTPLGWADAYFKAHRPIIIEILPAIVMVNSLSQATHRRSSTMKGMATRKETAKVMHIVKSRTERW